MTYLNGENFVEVKDHRYKIHPTENNILRKRDPPKSLRTQYQGEMKLRLGKIRNLFKTIMMNI